MPPSYSRSDPAFSGHARQKGDQKAGRTLIRIARLAGVQDGVVGRRELLASGIEAAAITHHLSAGNLVPVYRGAYAIGHCALSDRGRLRAALIAANGAALSHQSAALLYRILDERDQAIAAQVVHLTRASGSATGRRAALVTGQPPLQIHRARQVLPGDLAGRHRLAVTSIDRTLIDLAGYFPARKLESIVLRAHRLRLLDTSRLSRRLQQIGKGWTGIRALKEIAEGLAPAKSRTLSDPEAWMLDLLRRHRLPEPEVNVWAEGFLVDFLWRSQKLVVEFDGHAFHSSRQALQRDKERNRKLQLAGYTVLRYTYEDLVGSPRQVAAEIAAALGLQPF